MVTVSAGVKSRVAAKAAASELLVSSAVKNLVLEPGVRFKDRRLFRLKGVPEKWRLYGIDS
jgi:hypothetical protein